MEASKVPSSLKREIPVEVIEQPSIENCANLECNVVHQTCDWRLPYVKYLSEGTLPEDHKLRRRVKARAFDYCIIDKGFYRRAKGSPDLKCLSEEEAAAVLKELHEGVCGSHSGGRSLAYRPLSQGYFWPFMTREATEFSRRCKSCQKHANINHQPPELLHSVISPWPFMQWGLDIVGPLPKGTSGLRFILVMTDYFGKWVEAEAFTKIEAEDVVKFARRNIIFRFRIPKSIVTDNGPQFDSIKFRRLCDEYGIQLRFALRTYPQSNGQAEASNKTILTCLKRRLEAKKGKWPEVLLQVIWAYRTSVCEATGTTPYALVFGTKAVIPMEFRVPTLRSELLEGEEREATL